MTGEACDPLKTAVQIAIRSLGVARCSELCGDCADASVYRYANINEPHLVPIDYARALDREIWLRDGIAPFREAFEKNAGEPLNARVARQLRALADNMAEAGARTPYREGTKK